MEFSNNVATRRLVLNHDDKTHDSVVVVPDPGISESDVNADGNNVADVATRLENMDISRGSNSCVIRSVGTNPVCELNYSDADAFVYINDIKTFTKDDNDISYNELTTSDIDESTDDDNTHVDDVADTNNNNEVTCINDILNVMEDNKDISNTVLTNSDSDESTCNANRIVEDVANTNNNNYVSLAQSITDSLKTNVSLVIVPTFNCNESSDMPNIIRIVTRPRTNTTNYPFSKAVRSPLPSSLSLPKKQGSRLPLPIKTGSPNTKGPTPFFPNKKPSRLPVPIKRGSTPFLLDKQDSRPSLPNKSNDQGSIPTPPDTQGSRPSLQMHGSTPYLPDNRTLRSTMIIPQIAVHTQSCCTCPSQLIIQPPILVNMETYCNCCPQEPFSVPPNIPRPNAQFLPRYPRFNRAPFPYLQFNRAPLPYRQYNRTPLPYPQLNRAPLPYPQFNRAPLPRMQQREQIMFVPRRYGQSEPCLGPSPPFNRTRMPYIDHRQGNSPRPKNWQPIKVNFPPPQRPLPDSYNNRLPNMRSSNTFPSVRPHFQPRNPNGMNTPSFRQNNVPGASIYPPSFDGARPPVHPMPPPSFYPERFPDDIIGQESFSSPLRFGGRSPPGFENVELEPLPEISEAHVANDICDQIKRKKGQLPLYLRKT